MPFTAFASGNKADRVAGRLVVRRIPHFNAPADPNQASPFELWRFHAFFTTTDPQVLNTIAADKTHRGHAIIEQVHADLKNSALAHLPEVILSRLVDHAADLGFCVVEDVVDAGGEGSGQHGPMSFERCFPGVSRRLVVPSMAPVRCSPRACSTVFRSARFSIC